MAIVPQAAAAMSAVLAEEIRELKGFLKLLEQEQVLLVGGDQGDALMSLVGRKTEFTTRLEGLLSRREQVLTSAGKPKGRAGMEAWLVEVPGNDPARNAWEELLKLAAESRRLNGLNGKLIGVHLQHNQAALATLMSAADRAMTYGPDGQQKTGGGGRSFGSA